MSEMSKLRDAEGTARATSRPGGIGGAPTTAVRHFIAGEFVPPVDGEYLDGVEPATGTLLSHVPRGSAEDVARAVEAAASAFREVWAHSTASQRSDLLMEIARLIDERAEELAALESRDTGKPIALARSVDIPRASLNFRFFAGAVLHTSTACHPTDEVALNYTVRRPLGVAGLISPWNLPLYLLSWKVAPAIAAGNTCVAKPSELTPLTANALAEIAMQAGLPPGVVNIVHGEGPRAGAALVEHPGVPVISFTGGTATGHAVARGALPHFKKLSLELGGKNPNIVFEDCDFDEAISVSLRSSFANQGQICLCGSRIFVERSLYEQFVEALAARSRALVIGDPTDPRTEIGALISADHQRKVESYIELARAEGGEIVTGGKRPAGLPGHLAGGFFLEPTIIAGLGPACRTMQEEIFGPVVTVTAFDDEEEVVAAANSTRYGLSATVWTSHLRRAHRLAAALEVGTVWINTWLFRDLRVPFGGMKDSGIGREGGTDSLEFFTESKNVCVKL